MAGPARMAAPSARMGASPRMGPGSLVASRSIGLGMVGLRTRDRQRKRCGEQVPEHLGGALATTPKSLRS